MTRVLSIHPIHPQVRLLQQAIDLLKQGAVMAYPTDSCYALGCRLGDKAAIERIRRLRGMDKHHHFTLICRDLSELSTYANVDNPSFRILKAYTPGPYTFILKATKEVPKRLQQPKRRTIGLRIPDSAIVQKMLYLFGEPLMSTSLLLPDYPEPLVDVCSITDNLDTKVDLILDGGHCPAQPTSVIDLVSGIPEVLRQGAGDVSAFL